MNKATKEAKVFSLSLTMFVCDEHVESLKARYRGDVEETILQK